LETLKRLHEVVHTFIFDNHSNLLSVSWFQRFEVKTFPLYIFFIFSFINSFIERKGENMKHSIKTKSYQN